jgi:ABC-2 type transport system permease protein
VSRRALLGGKFAAALSVWFAAFAVSIPYLWVLSRGVFIVDRTLLLGLVVGTLLAVGLVAIGQLVSAVSSSNKVSLAVSLFLLLALFAPTQLPKLPQGLAGDVIRRVNPVGAGMHYLNGVVVSGFGWTRELSYLISPLVVVVLAGGALVAFGPRIVRLAPGVSGE